MNNQQSGNEIQEENNEKYERNEKIIEDIFTKEQAEKEQEEEEKEVEPGTKRMTKNYFKLTRIVIRLSELAEKKFQSLSADSNYEVTWSFQEIQSVQLTLNNQMVLLKKYQEDLVKDHDINEISNCETLYQLFEVFQLYDDLLGCKITLLEVIFELINLDGFISELVNKTRLIQKHITYICRQYLQNYSALTEEHLSDHQQVQNIAFKLICKMLIIIPSKMTEKGLSWVVIENLFCSPNCIKCISSDYLDMESKEFTLSFIDNYFQFQTRQLAFLTTFKLLESVPERMIPNFETFLPQPLFDRICYFQDKMSELIDQSECTSNYKDWVLKKQFIKTIILQDQDIEEPTFQWCNKHRQSINDYLFKVMDQLFSEYRKLDFEDIEHQFYIDSFNFYAPKIDCSVFKLMTHEVVLQDIQLRIFNKFSSLNPREWAQIENFPDKIRNGMNIVQLGEKSLQLNNQEKFFIELIQFIDALIRNSIQQMGQRTSNSLSIHKKNDRVLLEKLKNINISKLISLSFASLIIVYYKIIIINNIETEKNFDPSKKDNNNKAKRNVLFSGQASIIDSHKDNQVGLSLRCLRQQIDIYFSNKQELSLHASEGSFFVFSQLMQLIFDKKDNLHDISIKVYLTLVIRQIKNFKPEDFLATKDPRNICISELKTYLYILWRIIIKRIDMIPLTINEDLIEYLKTLNTQKGPWVPTIDSILFILSKDRHQGSNVNYNKMKNYHEIKNHNIWCQDQDYKVALIPEIRYKYDENVPLEKYWDFKLPIFTKDCYEFAFSYDD